MMKGEPPFRAAAERFYLGLEARVVSSPVNNSFRERKKEEKVGTANSHRFSSLLERSSTANRRRISCNYAPDAIRPVTMADDNSSPPPEGNNFIRASCSFLPRKPRFRNRWRRDSGEPRSRRVSREMIAVISRRTGRQLRVIEIS